MNDSQLRTEQEKGTMKRNFSMLTAILGIGLGLLILMGIILEDWEEVLGLIVVSIVLGISIRALQKELSP